MDLIERYLAAIGRQLPAKEAGDIMAELRDVLLSRVEEQEARLGRPLQKAEVEALLVDFGNPLAVAGRYRKTQHLIGPEVFPFWWATVKVMLLAMAGFYFVVIVLAVLTHKAPAEISRSIPLPAEVVIYLFGLITLVFAAFERFGKTAFLRKWKPARLPPAGGKRPSAFELAAGVAWDLVVLAWWLGAFRVRDLAPMPYPDFITVSMAPVWAAWRWPIAAYLVADSLARLLAIARPGWVTTNATTLIVRHLAGIGILTGILQAGHWLVVDAPTLSPRVLDEIQTNFDLGMRVGLTFAIFGFAVAIAVEAWRQWRMRQAMARPVGAG